MASAMLPHATHLSPLLIPSPTPLLPDRNPFHPPRPSTHQSSSNASEIKSNFLNISSSSTLHLLDLKPPMTKPSTRLQSEVPRSPRVLVSDGMIVFVKLHRLQESAFLLAKVAPWSLSAVFFWSRPAALKNSRKRISVIVHSEDHL